MEEDAKQRRFNNRMQIVNQKIDLLGKSRGYAVQDPVTGAVNTYPGLQGYRIDLDGDGLPDIFADEGASPGLAGIKTPPVDPYARALAGERAKAAGELAETRPMVSDAVSEITRVKELNKDSYGGAIGAVTQKAKSLLNMGEDDPKFQNTADVVNTMQAQVARVLKSTFGGQLSDGERAYLNEVYGALPNMSQTERDVAMRNVSGMLESRLRQASGKFSELSGKPQSKTSFDSVEEAEAANLPKGTIIMIGGRRAVVE
jgi:hypothetical protein